MRSPVRLGPGFRHAPKPPRIIAIAAVVFGVCCSRPSNPVSPSEVVQSRNSTADKRTLELGVAKELLQNGINAAENGHAFIRDDIAKEVTPADYIYLILHDPDRRFRAHALEYFGSEISPKLTLFTISYLAANDPDMLIRLLSLIAIDGSLRAGKLRGSEPQIERLAISRLHRKPEDLEAVTILGDCHTASARRALRGVLSGKYDESMRKAAAMELGLKPPSSAMRR